MASEKRTANPINPRGIPRGIAKPDVYWMVGRLGETGLFKLECDALEHRLGYRPAMNKRPSAEETAQALLLEADFRDWRGEELTDRERRIGDALRAGRIDNKEHDELLQWAWAVEARDLRRWAGVLLATKLRRSDEEDILLRRLDSGEEVEIPDDLERAAAKHLRRERRRDRGELSGKWERPPFRRQLGKLPEQTDPVTRRQTVYELRRSANALHRRARPAFTP